MYINTTTLQYPVSEPDIRAAHPNTSWPQVFSPPAGYDTVLPTTQPECDPITHKVVEVAPVNVAGRWVQEWLVVPHEVGQVAANIATDSARKIGAIAAALDAHFDAVAQARRYDNRITCALRAGYVGPFQAEGVAFAQWMDQCYTAAHVMLAEVQAGTRAMPATIDEALALLPVMVWPN